jgi:uncharacterized protein YceK
MRKFLILAALAIGLSGCTTISAVQGYAITQGQVDAARNTYDGTALATLKSYAGLPRCARGTAFSLTNRCHDAALLKKMRNADAAVSVAFNSTQDQITSGNSSGAVAAYKTLQTAIAAVKQIISDNNLTGI